MKKHIIEQKTYKLVLIEASNELNADEHYNIWHCNAKCDWLIDTYCNHS